jgi:transcription termination/antitermination protein NusG
MTEEKDMNNEEQKGVDLEQSSEDTEMNEVENEMEEEASEETEREKTDSEAEEDEAVDESESAEDNLEKKMEAEDTDTGNEDAPEPESESEEKDPNAVDIDDERYRWYAVRIISGHENKVKAYLDSEIRTEGYDDKIKNVLIPLEKVFEVKGGKKKVKFKNFLPGYILIQAELDDRIRNFISQAPSIINMVGSKSVQGAKLDPIPLKKNEVKRIAALLSEDSETEKIDLHLNVGDPVKVTSGPFNNFNGNVLEINTEKMKVKVMVSIFGRKTPIELEFTQIEKEK